MILHNDIDMPFPKPGQEPYQLAQLEDLLRRHPKTTIIWAHSASAAIVRPVTDQVGDRRAGARTIPRCAHVYIDISWDEVAKYIVATPEAIAARRRTLINRYPDRFLFGTDEVAPTEPGEVPEGLRHVRAAVRDS